MHNTDLPTVRLNAKANARAIRHGFPWAYDNEVVTDRRTKALAPGTVALLEDADRQVMGLVAVNPNSKIFCRMLDRDTSRVIGQDWFADRLKTALDHRKRLFDAPFYRLVHAEADGLPGVVIDRFGDIAVVQPNAAWADARLDDLVDALVAVTGITTVVKNATGRARSLEGLGEDSRVLKGSVSGPVPVSMNGAIYRADLLGGQKTGLFYDQRPNHAFAQSLASENSDARCFQSCRGVLACGAGCRGGLGACGRQFRSCADACQRGCRRHGTAGPVRDPQG